ncbi:MAG: rcp1 2 [Bacteroidetes bacterium]|nr:rcp1 2 [Bacteroidota bacterium]
MEKKTLHLLLAEENKHDCLLFNKALVQIPIPTKLKTVNDGEQLMNYLVRNIEKLPDLLFLDFNMPCKSGTECLNEIKKHDKLKDIPVVVYSSSLHKDVTTFLYDQGAHYHIKKVEFVELKLTLHRILNTLIKTEFSRPNKRQFIFNLVEV